MSKYKLSFKNFSDLLKYAEDQGVQFIHYNFTDLSGKWHHNAQHISACTDDVIKNGLTVNGSKFPGWTGNLLLKPDISKVSYDPFAAQKTLKVICDLSSPLDPRNITRKAQDYLKKSKIGDVAYFGSEIEFFIFDNIKVINTANQVGYHVDSEEAPYNKGRDYVTGNMGHRPAANGGYLGESPVDSLSDIRAEMLSVIDSMGIDVKSHYHGAASAQCAIVTGSSALLDAADNVQIYKYAVRNVASSYGKSATFMPRPLNGECGSTMRILQTITKNGKPLFADNELASYYIGGILKHARALNAFTNPTTNSYKRLIADDEITFVQSTTDKCVESCFPDSAANSYLAFSALLMAGLDGIENKIQPDEIHYENCRSLRQALESLEKDCEFLLKDEVFTEDFIKAYIAIKTKEVGKYETTTHPEEVNMYYSS